MGAVLIYLMLATIGLMFGNYATTAFHRIPNGKALNGHDSLDGKKPHCSVCNHPLKFYEYLPVLSWFSTRFNFKCNYCGAKIDPVYTILEVFGLILAFTLYLLVELDITYVFLLCNWMCFALFVALFLRYQRIYYQVVTLQIMLIGGMLIWKMLQ